MKDIISIRLCSIIEISLKGKLRPLTDYHVYSGSCLMSGGFSDSGETVLDVGFGFFVILVRTLFACQMMSQWVELTEFHCRVKIHHRLS